MVKNYLKLKQNNYFKYVLSAKPQWGGPEKTIFPNFYLKVH